MNGISNLFVVDCQYHILFLFLISLENNDITYRNIIRTDFFWSVISLNVGTLHKRNCRVDYNRDY